MVKRTSRQSVSMAYALGGLGGNNFFGLGFLAAAVENRAYPDMISATSGQIHLVWLFQKAKPDRDGHNRLQDDYKVNNLRELAAVYSDKVEIRPTMRLDPLAAVKVGYGVFRHLSDYKTLQESGPLPYSVNVVANSCPAAVMEMCTKGGVLKRIAEDFNRDEQMGIAFNSYDPTTGTESVYLNPRAAELLDKDLSKNQKSTFRKSESHVVIYKPITKDAVRDALWLYEYGFDAHTVLDGCYFRQLMLHELTRARLIVCVRPIRCKWTAELPVYWLDKEDLKTKVFFNAAYAGERFRIELMNRLYSDKRALTREFIKKRGYHKIRFLEIEPSRDWPASSLFAEEMTMFEDGYQVSLTRLGTASARKRELAIA